MSQIFEKLSEADARIERVISVAGAVASVHCISDDLKDFFSYEDDEAPHYCFGPMPDDFDFDSEEEIAGWLIEQGKLGFLVKFATPVMRRGAFSWGYYSTRWVYADTIDDAINAGLAWVAECRAREIRAEGRGHE